MVIFLVLSALYLIGWGIMFDSETFRWTFVEWGFFGATATLSALLVIVGFVVGVMCRLNFNKGLANYLNAESPIRGDSFIQTTPENPSDEKFDFPSTRHPIPTFSATLGPNDKGPFSSQMGFQAGPRFFNQSAASFDPQVDIESVAGSSPGRSVSPETVSVDSTYSLSREGSQRSTSSYASSTVAINGPSVGQPRWVIE